MAVFGAMFSYILQAMSLHPAAANQPHIERPYVSPLGIPGAVVTISSRVVTLLYQIQDPNFFKGVFWVLVWFAVGIVYFALVGRHKLILSPEEEFALEHATEGRTNRSRQIGRGADGPAASAAGRFCCSKGVRHGRQSDVRRSSRKTSRRGEIDTVSPPSPTCRGG